MGYTGLESIHEVVPTKPEIQFDAHRSGRELARENCDDACSECASKMKGGNKIADFADSA
jgi:hypothetical protein